MEPFDVSGSLDINTEMIQNDVSGSLDINTEMIQNDLLVRIICCSS